MDKKRKIAFQRMVDSDIGKPFYLPFLMIRKIDKRKFPKKINKVAIFRLSSIGDSILLLPAIKNLKEKTGARVTVICANENFPVFQGQDFIDKIIILDNKILNPFKALHAVIKVRRENPDLVIDTTHSSNLSAFFSYFTGAYCIGFSNPVTKIKNKMYDNFVELDTKKHAVFNYLDLFQIAKIGYEKEKIKLVKPLYTKRNELKIAEIIKSNKKIIGIHAISSPLFKKWSPENFTKLIKFISAKNHIPVFIGSEAEGKFVEEIISHLNEKERKKVMNLCGKTNISELFALMNRFKGFIGLDGGPMHMAASMDIPVLGIFTKAPDDPVA
ncbi:MAG: glycosyltransferase family 9 protein, partial [Candidatus Pacearchaeota archaeon]